jgi:hypothetical protein
MNENNLRTLKLSKYSMGIGDRFGCQGKAQLQAFIEAKKNGLNITPAWNKSHREHTIVKTTPLSVRKEADSAVKELGWKGSYFVDADHISLKNVDLFMDSSDFFTLDVADFSGVAADDKSIAEFVKKYKKYAKKLEIDGISQKLSITENQIEDIAKKYLLAVQEAGKIYRHISLCKGKDNFIIEVSMDETDRPQTPIELFFILAAIADEGIAAQTIAPKFIGRFNKGVDYVGDIDKFSKEFSDDIAVIEFAKKEFSLEKNLKLSIHSGSDKFSIYPCINKAIKKFNAGLHVKTAGTTWLEELISLAEVGGDGLKIAKEIYMQSFKRIDELCQPYASVLDIDLSKLPSPDKVACWSAEEYASSLRHNQKDMHYNLNFRQFLRPLVSMKKMYPKM